MSSRKTRSKREGVILILIGMVIKGMGLISPMDWYVFAGIVGALYGINIAAIGLEDFAAKANGKEVDELTRKAMLMGKTNDS